MRRRVRLPIAALALVASVLAVAVSATAGRPMVRFVHVFTKRLRPDALPTPSGPFAVADVTVALASSDASDGTKAIPVQLWSPVGTSCAASQAKVCKAAPPGGGASPGMDAALPVLLYAPGLLDTRNDNTITAADLASHGYAVVAMDDVDVDEPPPVGKPSEPAGFDLSSPQAFAATLRSKDAKVRRQAERAIRVLDRLSTFRAPPGVPWPAGLRLDRVGFFGWSFGGATAQEAAILDPRIVASVNMDGWLFGAAADGAQRKPTLTILSDYPAPTQADLGDARWSTRLDALMDCRDLREKISLGLRPDSSFLRLEGAIHEDYADKIFDFRNWRAWSRADPYAVKRAVNDTLLAFFDRHLRGRPSSRLDGDKPSRRDAAFLAESEGWCPWPFAPLQDATR